MQNKKQIRFNVIAGIPEDAFDENVPEVDSEYLKSYEEHMLMSDLKTFENYENFEDFNFIIEDD